MHWIDWMIVAVPLAVVFFIAFKARKFVQGVSDFLAAGRVAGRYIVAVASGEASMGLISLVAMFEVYYNSGFGYGFWMNIQAPLVMVFMLTGYCVYRFRETRAMTMGQFLEMRYNRSFRIFAAVLQTISGVLNYALFPAVGARFLIYYCDLPLQVTLLGLSFPTFGLVMAICLGLAVIIVTLGGQITIMVTDCVQGLINYALYGVIIFFILYSFSWSEEMAPALLDRPPGMSMLNPFDISKLRTFNLFFVLVGLFSTIMNRMAWSGIQGYQAAALNAHEQKMGGVLSGWRLGFANMVFILLGIAGYTYLNHSNYAAEARATRTELAWKTVNDVAPGPAYEAVREDIRGYLETGSVSPSLLARLNGELPGEDEQEPMRVVVRDALAAEDPGTAQTFGAIYGQMRVPVALRRILPIGITGIFCAICIFLMISSDTTYMHSWGSIIVQDLILPIRGRPFTPRQQLLLLRLIITGVAFFAFFFSFFFSQIDFILMFFMITGAVWLGGAGPTIVGGLYWKRGTTAGAFSALIAGSTIATGGMVTQKMWVTGLYPWLEASGRLPMVTRIIEGFSRPFEPYILWRVTPDAFPINSQEMFFLAMLVGIGLYIGVSLLTCKEPFNMERMLHRGKYTPKGEKVIVFEKLTWRNAYRKLVGITPEYTKGDKALAWLVFTWSAGWAFGSFVIILVWNLIAPWPNHWWANWFRIYSLMVPAAIAVVSFIWFGIGGTLDLRRLFARLREKEVNVLDDGRVIGHISADDVDLVEEVEQVRIDEAHREEEALRKEKEGGDPGRE